MSSSVEIRGVRPAEAGRAAARRHLLLKYPDRDEPENANFTSFTGEIRQDDVVSLPEKGEWRVEEIRAAHDRPNPELVRAGLAPARHSALSFGVTSTLLMRSVVNPPSAVTYMRTSAGCADVGTAPISMRLRRLVPLSLREAAKGNEPDYGDDDAEQDAPDQSDDDPCNDEDPAKADANAAACVPAFGFMRSHQVSFSKVSTTVPVQPQHLTP